VLLIGLLIPPCERASGRKKQFHWKWSQRKEERGKRDECVEIWADIRDVHGIKKETRTDNTGGATEQLTSAIENDMGSRWGSFKRKKEVGLKMNQTVTLEGERLPSIQRTSKGPFLTVG